MLLKSHQPLKKVSSGLPIRYQDRSQAYFLLRNDCKLFVKHILEDAEMFPVVLECIWTFFGEDNLIFYDEITMGFQFLTNFDFSSQYR